MDGPDTETILDLIDKIVGFADNQPLILNHLHVLRPRVEALESRIGALEAEARNNDLAPLAASLQEQLAAAQQEIAKLKTQRDAQSADLPEPQHGLLAFLNAQLNPSIEEIAQHLGMSENGARFHLVELDRAELVYSENFTDGRQNWRLSQDGRKYLHDRCLLH